MMKQRQFFMIRCDRLCRPISRPIILHYMQTLHKVTKDIYQKTDYAIRLPDMLYESFNGLII